MNLLAHMCNALSSFMISVSSQTTGVISIHAAVVFGMAEEYTNQTSKLNSVESQLCFQ